jgi:hypothetical protein
LLTTHEVSALPPRKVKFEVLDQEGNRFSIAFEGRVTRDKVLQVIDLIELLGGVTAPGSNTERNYDELSKIARTQELIKQQFPAGWFSSKDVQDAYADAFNQPIGLSTVATYLTRLSEKGVLIRGGSIAERRYRLRREFLPEGSMKLTT